MSRVSSFLVVLVLLSTAVSAQPPEPPPVIRIEMQAGPPGQPVPQMPPRDNSQPIKPGKAILRGHVVAAETGQPLRKAQVRVTAPELRENRMATTDADGKYEFKELPAGRYNVMASKGSYVALSYGQQRPFEPGKPLEILEAQTVEKVDFALPRGGVITGRILDEFGEPLPDAQVMAQRYQNIGGRRRLMVAGRPGMTNDIGEFRLFAIPPGQYYLSATVRGMNMTIGDTDDRSGYAPTYFPGTATIAEAQRVTVGLGQIVSDMNMALMTTRTARITGTAVDSQGRPMMGMVMAAPLGDSMMMMFGPPGQIKPDGSFAIRGLAPGGYRLQTMGGTGDTESASVEVSISGDDVNGIRLVGSKPSTASGRIIVDAAAAQALKPAMLRVMAQPVAFDGPMMGPPAPPAAVNDDLTFELKTRPGKMRISLAGQATGWSIRAVKYHGLDMTDSGIEFKANEDITDIDVELTNRVTDLSGLVTNGRGAAVKDYSVIVFPQDRDKWTPGSRYLRSARPDQDGRFKFSGLPPGDYYALALDYVDSSDWTEPEYLERVRSKATSLSISEGETKSVDLKITTAT
jgi:protocatechuate 3,4-dioxygenase beta subunit